MSDATTIRVLALSGSLRRASLNTALLRAVAELAPAGMKVVIHNLGPVPMYNEDLHADGDPPDVAALREAARTADAFLLATPCYSRSFSGAMKNALDWLSRPPAPPMAGKAAVVTGASPGALGTGPANYHLRHVLSAMNVFVVPGPEVLVGQAGGKFDAGGRLTDAATRDFLAAHLVRLGDLARRLR